MVCVSAAATTTSVGSIAGSLSPCLCFTTTNISLAIPFLSKNPNISLNLTSPSSRFSSTQPFLRHCGIKQDLETSSSSSGFVGANDLLIVGPGVLGRLIAQKWREDNEGCQITGETFTTDHHDELIKIGITPSLKGKKASQKYPYVVFCAPPSRSPDYPGDVRYYDHALLKLCATLVRQEFKFPSAVIGKW